MVKHYLDFEKPLVELEREIEHLKRFSSGRLLHLDDHLKNLEEKLHRLQKEIFSNLTGWQITQLARHIDRPKTSHLFNGYFKISSNFTAIGTMGMILPSWEGFLN